MFDSSLYGKEAGGEAGLFIRSVAIWEQLLLPNDVLYQWAGCRFCCHEGHTLRVVVVEHAAMPVSIALPSVNR